MHAVCVSEYAVRLWAVIFILFAFLQHESYPQSLVCLYDLIISYQQAAGDDHEVLKAFGSLCVSIWTLCIILLLYTL